MAARVAAAAVANGWAPSAIGLDELPSQLERMTRLVLCGGDGLVHRALQVVAGHPVEVAVVPVGTGNDLARAFGVRAGAAIALAASAPGAARVQAVDLIAADRCGTGGPYAATVLTAGYSGRVNATANAMRFPPGSAKYTLAALREIGRLRPRDVRLTVHLPDGGREVIDRPMTLMAIGNTTCFGGGMRICPGADPSDGRLEVVTVGPLGRVDLVRWLPSVFAGRHVAHAAVSTTTATAVTIETVEPLWADGEPFASGATTLTVRIAAGALRLLTP